MSRDVFIKLRVTPEERDILKKLAKDQRFKNFAAMVRVTFLDGKADKGATTEEEFLLRMLSELQKQTAALESVADQETKMIACYAIHTLATALMQRMNDSKKKPPQQR